MSFMNVSYRRIGGLRFIKIGRLTLSFSIAQAYRPMATEAETLSRRARTAELNRIRRYAERYEQVPMPLYELHA